MQEKKKRSRKESRETRGYTNEESEGGLWPDINNVGNQNSDPETSFKPWKIILRRRGLATAKKGAEKKGEKGGGKVKRRLFPL